jgi:hypothetical protein
MGGNSDVADLERRSNEVAASDAGVGGLRRLMCVSLHGSESFQLSSLNHAL